MDCVNTFLIILKIINTPTLCWYLGVFSLEIPKILPLKYATLLLYVKQLRRCALYPLFLFPLILWSSIPGLLHNFVNPVFLHSVEGSSSKLGWNKWIYFEMAFQIHYVYCNAYKQINLWIIQMNLVPVNLILMIWSSMLDMSRDRFLKPAYQAFEFLAHNSNSLKRLCTFESFPRLHTLNWLQI